MEYSIEKTPLITLLKGRQPGPYRVSFQCVDSKMVKNLCVPWDYANLVQKWFSASQSGTALDQIQKGHKGAPFELRSLLL